MILLAVNLHYVRAEPPASPRAIYPTTVGDLEALLAKLGETFDFVSRDQLLAAVEDDASLPKYGCVITFDDGLREQFEVALPVLDRLGIPATFFVPGRPLAEGRALHVHKLHALRETLTAGDFEHELALALEGTPYARLEVDAGAAQAMYRYDTPADARVKYLLNVALPRDLRESLVHEIFCRCVGDEDAFAAAIYMDRSQVARLEREYRALGAHGYSHQPLRRLRRHDQLDELERSAKLLAEIAGARPRIVSYPYGGTDAVDEEVGAIAFRCGFHAGFTMERALNRSLQQPLLLARVDWLDAPGGKRPLVAVDPEIRCVGGMTGARRRYFEELETTEVA